MGPPERLCIFVRSWDAHWKPGQPPLSAPLSAKSETPLPPRCQLRGADVSIRPQGNLSLQSFTLSAPCSKEVPGLGFTRHGFCSVLPLEISFGSPNPNNVSKGIFYPESRLLGFFFPVAGSSSEPLVHHTTENVRSPEYSFHL